jgi:hypothetical protein
VIRKQLNACVELLFLSFQKPLAPALQKPEGFRAKGAAIVSCGKPLATPEMKFSGFPEG